MLKKTKSSEFPLALSFDDVLLVPQCSRIDSRSEVDLSTKISPKTELEIPLITTNMDLVTGVKMAIKISKLGGMGILPRFESIESQTEKVAQVVESSGLAAGSIGIKEDLERAESLVNAGATVLNIDVAHGHMQKNLEFTKKVKNRFKEKITLISGIASTGECARDLYRAGADSVFIGIGGGSICTTRIQTGCGLPTFESLLKIKDVARKMRKTFIPCAGIKNSGDIVKSLAAGASAIAAGSLFAGTEETPGEILEINGKMYKKYNGSTSEQEKKKHLERTPEGKSERYIKHVEGVEGLVEFKGPVEGVVTGLLAGVKSGFSYCGAEDLSELWKRAKFVRITQGGIRENGAHDIVQLK